MDMQVYENHLKIDAVNLPQFYALLDKAKKEAQQLNDSIAKLSRFEFDIVVSATVSQAGDMEEASSVIRTIPTK